MRGESPSAHTARIEALRDYLLTGGAEPYEALLSAACESFNCPPDVIDRQDWPTVEAIMNFRSATQAMRIWNDGEGAEQIENSPSLTYWKNVIVFGEDVALQIASAEPMEEED